MWPGIVELTHKDMTFFGNSVTKQGLPPIIDSDLARPWLLYCRYKKAKKRIFSRWIVNQIPPNFDILKFEIGLLEAEQIKYSNVDQITPTTTIIVRLL